MEEDSSSILLSIVCDLYRENVFHMYQDNQDKEDNEKRENRVVKFTGDAKSRSYDENRQFLKTQLTVLQFNPSEEILQRIDKLLLEERKSRTIVSWKDISMGSLNPIWKVVIWRGDITTLEVDVIVNAANKYMLGCFTPNHACIDNVIHSKAGARLRKECREIMKLQNSLEPTGDAKITQGYCLPSKYVLHTVGPIARCQGDEQPKLLKSCYMSCLNLMKQHSLRTIAFCCVSTGVFGYPQQAAAGVALETVKEWLLKDNNIDNVDRIIFDVFTVKDHEIYLEQAPLFFQ